MPGDVRRGKRGRPARAGHRFRVRRAFRQDECPFRAEGESRSVERAGSIMDTGLPAHPERGLSSARRRPVCPPWGSPVGTNASSADAERGFRTQPTRFGRRVRGSAGGRTGSCWRNTATSRRCSAARGPGATVGHAGRTRSTTRHRHRTRGDGCAARRPRAPQGWAGGGCPSPAGFHASRRSCRDTTIHHRPLWTPRKGDHLRVSRDADATPRQDRVGKAGLPTASPSREGPQSEESPDAGGGLRHTGPGTRPTVEEGRTARAGMTERCPPTNGPAATKVPRRQPTQT